MTNSDLSQFRLLKRDSENLNRETCLRCGRTRSAHTSGHVSVLNHSADSTICDGYAASLIDCLCRGGFVSTIVTKPAQR